MCPTPNAVAIAKANRGFFPFEDSPVFSVDGAIRFAEAFEVLVPFHVFSLAGFSSRLAQVEHRL